MSKKKTSVLARRPVIEYSRGGRRRIVESETKSSRPVEVETKGKKTEEK